MLRGLSGFRGRPCAGQSCCFLRKREWSTGQALRGPEEGTWSLVAVEAGAEDDSAQNQPMMLVQLWFENWKSVSLDASRSEISVADRLGARRTYSGPTEFWAAILKLISPADGALDRQIKNYNFE
jgi:hypothetical protein